MTNHRLGSVDAGHSDTGVLEGKGNPAGPNNPFGDKGFIVQRKGGDASILRKNNATVALSGGNQSVFQRDLEFIDPASNTGQRTVRVNDMRRITLGALVFPKHFGGITPYAGLGYTITVLGDARVFVDSVNTFPSNAFLDEVERERSRSAVVGIGGIQIQASKMAIFAQETLVPSNPSFLFNSVLNFFEFGIRLNFGSSIDRD